MTIRNVSQKILYLSEKILNLFDFVDRFPDEGSCRAHFKKERDRLGIVCKKMWLF